MLVLTRTEGEEVVISIGGRVIARCMLAEIRGDKIRLGFIAEQGIEVNRLEVFASKYPTQAAAIESFQPKVGSAA